MPVLERASELIRNISDRYLGQSFMLPAPADEELRVFSPKCYQIAGSIQRNTWAIHVVHPRTVDDGQFLLQQYGSRDYAVESVVQTPEGQLQFSNEKMLTFVRGVTRTRKLSKPDRRLAFKALKDFKKKNRRLLTSPSTVRENITVAEALVLADLAVFDPKGHIRAYARSMLGRAVKVEPELGRMIARELITGEIGGIFAPGNATPEHIRAAAVAVFEKCLSPVKGRVPAKTTRPLAACFL